MKNSPRRILAILGIIILAGLYITTLILAVIGNEKTNTWFMACIIATVVVPIMMWVCSWLYNMIRKDVNDAITKGSEQEDPDGGQTS